MSDPLELLAFPDRPATPREGFRRELLARIEREASPGVAVDSPDADRRARATEPTRASRRPLGRRRFRRPAAAAAAALVVIVAIGSVGLLFRSHRDSDRPADLVTTTVPSTTTSTGEPSLSSSGAFDGTRAALPAGFSPVAASPTDAGLLILATEDPPDPAGLPAENATLFLAESGQVRMLAELTGRPADVAWDGSSAWVAHFETGAVSRIDPVTGTVVGSVTPQLASAVTTAGDRVFVPNDLEAGLGSIWLLSARGGLAQIDPSSLEVRRVVELAAFHPSDLALGPTHAWVAQDDNTLVEVDPYTGDTTSYSLQHRGRRVVTSGDSVFVWGTRAGTEDGAVTIVNEGYGQVGVVETGATAYTLGVIDNRVGVLFQDGTFRDVYISDIELGPAVRTTWDRSAAVRGSSAGLVQLRSDGSVSRIGLAASAGVALPVRDFTDPRPVADAFAQSPDWERVAEPPIADRWPAVKASTGTAIIVFGGEHRGGGAAFEDGAVYDVAHDRWKTMPPVPIRVGTEPGWVWTGTELIVWDQDGVAAAYDPEADRWRTISEWPLRGGFYRRAVWTGDRIVDIDADLSVDPTDGSAVPIAPSPGIPQRAVPVWTGELIVLSTGGPVYRPATDEWLAGERNSLTELSSGAAWDGSEVIAVDYEGAVASYDPRSGEWTHLAPIPFLFGEWIPWMRRVGDTVAVESWPGFLVYRPDRDEWVHFAKPTATGSSVQLIPSGADLYGWDGGMYRLTTPVEGLPRRSQLDGVNFDMPPGWEVAAGPPSSETRAVLTLRSVETGADCLVSVAYTDAWRAFAALPAGAVVEIQPIVGGDPVTMVETRDDEGVTLSWAPYSTEWAQVSCSNRADAESVAAHLWIPWQ
jgi:hypothetical protein